MSDDPHGRIEQLEQRVQMLEAYVRALQAKVDQDERGHDATPPASVVGTWNAPPPRSSWPPPVAATSPSTTRPPFVFESEVVLKWGGVGLVVLAVGFAVSTAISRGWIGPELQLVGALAVALGLIGAGLRVRPTRPAWTHALCTGGVLALFTTFASDLFLDQANVEIAFGATALVGLAGAALARHVPSEWLGSANVLGALVAWFVIADREPSVVAGALWVGAIVAISVGLAVEQRWHALRPVAHVAGMIALLALADEASGDIRTIVVVAVVAVAALLGASLVRIPSIGDLTSTWQQLEVQLVVFVAPWLFGVLAIALDLDADTAVGVTAVSVGLGALAVALGVRAWIQPAHFVSQLIGASIALSIGLAVLMSTTVAFTALAVQGAGLVVLSRVLGGNARVLINAAALLFVATVFDIADMIAAWTDNASVGDHLAHAAIIAAIAIAAWQTYERRAWQLGAIVVLGLTLIWTGSVLVHLPQGQAAVSVSWAVIGTAVLVAGAVKKMPEMGGVGLAVLGLTVGKLLTVDLQEVDTLWRAGLFFLVGLGFLRLGFLLPRLMGSESGDDD